MINAKHKGNRRERQSKALLEAAGYTVTKAGGSLGLWDLCGISATDFVLIQVKSNRPPSPAEREALAGFRCPPNTRRLIHVWHDRERVPRVVEL